MKRFLSLLLALLLLFSALAGCAADPAEETGEPASSADTPAGDDASPEAVPETEPAYPPDSLPDDLAFDGTTVNIFGWSGPVLVEFYVDEENGEIVNDAIFARNLAVEERLGITLAYRLEPGAYDQRNDWVRALSASITAGDGAYDLSGGYSMAGASLASKGMCIPLNSLDYLDFEKPWWPASLLDEATCGGKLYFCSGDISTYMIYYLYGVYFNQDMLAEYEDLENPYDLVQSGAWTLDKMSSMASGVYVDLNGDGKKGFEDRLGYITYSIFVDPFFFSCGLRTTEKDEDDIPYLSPLFSGEKAHTVLEKVVEMVDGEGCLVGDGAPQMEPSAVMFQESRALFISHELTYAVNYLRDTTFTYGIVPYPKYDEEQADYVTITSFPYTLYGIPIDARDPAMSAAILEAMASESFRTVSPALFENAFKVKYAQDQQSSLMYDLIRSTVSFDFGRVFNNDLNGLTYSLFRSAVVSKNTNWASTMKANEKVLAKQLEKLTKSLLGD
ncbi:MAG: hypothetical protein J6V24_09880 [Clostridia bacterium]|nr:hypothetical protein [Clostridia bacterium]